MKICFLVFLLIIASGARGTSLEPFSVDFPRERLLSLLTNRDVYWDLNNVGANPILSANANAVLANFDYNESLEVRDWLIDQERAVVAHVLLTKRFKTGYSISGAAWNELQFISNEEFVCPKNVTRQLAKLWRDNPDSSGREELGTIVLDAESWFSDLVTELQQVPSLRVESASRLLAWREAEIGIMNRVQLESRGSLERAFRSLNFGRNHWTSLVPAPLTIVPIEDEEFPSGDKIMSTSSVSIPEKLSREERIRRRLLVEAERRRREEYARANPDEFENKRYLSIPVIAKREVVNGEAGWAIGCHWGICATDSDSSTLTHWSIYFIRDVDAAVIGFSSCD